MSFCVKCGTEISDDKDICDSCSHDVEKVNIDETYLDNLLNSVASSQASEREDLPKIQNKGEATEVESSGLLEKEMEDEKELMNEMDALEEKEDKNISLEETDSLDIPSVNDILAMETDDISDEMNNEEVNPAEEFDSLDSVLVSEFMSDDVVESYTDEEGNDIEPAEKIEEDFQIKVPDSVNDEEMTATEDIEDFDLNSLNIPGLEEYLDIENLDEDVLKQASLVEDYEVDKIISEDSELPIDESYDNLVGNMLDNLDSTGTLDNNTDSNSVNDNSADDISDAELMDLFNSMPGNELNDEVDDKNDINEEQNNDSVEMENDIFSIDDMFSSLENEESMEEDDYHVEGTDIGDVFAESLGAVTPHQDSSFEDEMFHLIPEKAEDIKPKKNIWQKLFGNVEDENAKPKDESETENIDDKSKKKKDKKKKVKKTTNEENNSESGEEQSEEGTDIKSKKSKKKKNPDKEKKTKEKKVKKIMQEIEEEEEGRINRIGAAIVFLFFAGITAFIILGTNTFSYAHSINSANSYFNKQKYDKAYNQLVGTDLTNKDKELYHKVATVMRVNKQLRSYEIYFSIEKYPEALDSLLKGLERYDNSIEEARNIGVSKDLKEIRIKIIRNLKESFDITEKEAYTIINSESRSEYISKVVDKAYGIN